VLPSNVLYDPDVAALTMTSVASSQPWRLRAKVVAVGFRGKGGGAVGGTREDDAGVEHSLADENDGVPLDAVSQWDHDLLLRAQ